MAEALALVVDIAVIVITGLLGYLSVKARQIHSQLRTHERIIFGEPEVDRWNGILGDTYQTKDRLNTVIQNQGSLIRQLQDQECIEVSDITTPRAMRENTDFYQGAGEASDD